MEETLAIIKPDAFNAGRDIISRLVSQGFEITSRMTIGMSEDDAKGFYAEHEGKPFYDGLVSHMSSGLSRVLVLKKANAVAAWRELIGPTDPVQAREAETDKLDDCEWKLRSKYGTELPRNAVHGSDSVESAAREMAFFWPDGRTPTAAPPPPTPIPSAPVEATLAIIKPDAFHLMRSVTACINKAKFDVVARKTVCMSLAMASEFYVEHEGKPFFDGLVEHMSSGLSRVYVLRGPGAIARWRQLIGPSDPANARKEDFGRSPIDDSKWTIRARFGAGMPRNAVHGSDSVESAAREVAFFFPAVDTSTNDAKAASVVSAARSVAAAGSTDGAGAGAGVAAAAGVAAGVVVASAPIRPKSVETTSTASPRARRSRMKTAATKTPTPTPKTPTPTPASPKAADSPLDLDAVLAASQAHPPTKADSQRMLPAVADLPPEQRIPDSGASDLPSRRSTLEKLQPPPAPSVPGSVANSTNRSTLGHETKDGDGEETKVADAAPTPVETGDCAVPESDATTGDRPRILVTGGAGYIGSHTVVDLVDNGFDVTVFDNLANSKTESIRRVKELTGKPDAVELVVGDLLSQEAVDSVCSLHTYVACIHFAGLKSVGESVKEPVHYYDTNITGTLNLIKGLTAVGCKNIVFSSSATVYGTAAPPMTESTPTGTGITNPYGQTKFMLEQVFQDVHRADPTWNVILLRYFNPVGAHPSGRLGEDPNGTPNNLLPYIQQVAVGRLKQLTVFGGDWNTEDGTAKRDFIHVVDLARGHVKAIQWLPTQEDGICEVFNLGTGTPRSVLEMVHGIEDACGHKVPYEIGPRRDGDLEAVWAVPDKARKVLGFAAEKTVEDMCADAWRWQSDNPDGLVEPEA